MFCLIFAFEYLILSRCDIHFGRKHVLAAERDKAVSRKEYPFFYLEFRRRNKKRRAVEEAVFGFENIEVFSGKKVYIRFEDGGGLTQKLGFIGRSHSYDS